MRKHFESCGKLLHVYIPGYLKLRILNSFALIYIRGECAEEKALTLSGSCMGGHKLVVEPYPFHATHLDHKFAPTRDADNIKDIRMFFEGYDTSLPLDRVESMLYRELGKCGRVCDIDVDQDIENEALLERVALVAAEGIDMVERLLQICGSDVKGLENIKSIGVVTPEADEASSANFSPWQFASTPSKAPEYPNIPNPPHFGSKLPYPWNVYVDSGTAALMCMRNTETGFVQYAEETPAPASRARYAPEDPNLPWPWIGLVDTISGDLYFWNTQTGVTQYQRPPSNYINGLF
ncbi:unnamed protein product [Microthlaspi erraticum]|uniref:WW domain-containing protein n=1 Tax=Microthlaspi erraticum TaxID=1685480 RepID=A0A6D2ITB8_9BRAS|nr:unnamed protein product [Microthlaspi erraticum]